MYSKATADTLTSGTIAFSGGMLATTGSQAFTVSSKGVVTITPPNPADVKLSIDSANGAVRGSFDFPRLVAGKTINSTVKYSGILLQDGTTPVIVGYFLSPIISGSGLSGRVITIFP